MDANTNFEEPVGEAAEAIAKRIIAEQERLAAEEKIEASLTVERKRLLTAGTDAETDECERRIDASRSAQVRILERVDLLTAQLQEANQVERAARLDAIAARAETARLEGEKLIRTDYPKLASQLGTLLKRLLLIDTAIKRENRTLHRAGREPVPASNYIRCTPPKYIDFLKTISVHPADPRHSLHAYAVPSRRTHGRDEHAVWVDSRDSTKVIERENIQVQTQERIGGDYPNPLYEVIALPPADPRPYQHETLPKQPIAQPYFEHDRVQITEADIDALFAEFESSPKTSKRKAA